MHREPVLQAGALDVTVDQSDIQVTELELPLELVENRALHNPMSVGIQAHRLVFKIDSEHPFNYQVGELIGITPPGEQRPYLF
ncbi:MAG: hypothetical protein ACR2PT_12885 [Endozoicomonas sp.]